MSQRKCIDSIVTENNVKFQLAELLSGCKFRNCMQEYALYFKFYAVGVNFEIEISRFY